ncbi:hypothetical protein N7528_002089 [Penicillium herquei]|nr:hypothetical protein N7528_002089 [Penicillium herquei]
MESVALQNIRIDRRSLTRFYLTGLEPPCNTPFSSLLQTFYGITYLEVSLIFLSPIVGFIISTLANHTLHQKLGTRGVAAIGGVCQLIAYVIASFHLPFYALVLAYVLVGLGAGCKNATWNSFISSLDNANELLGLLHGSYGMGATIMPALSSALFDKHHWKWYMIYYILIGLAASDLIISVTIFRSHDAKRYYTAHELELETLPHHSVRSSVDSCHVEAPKKRSVTLQCAKNKVVILVSCYLLAYVGSEVALGGWLVTFMEKVRHANSYDAGMTSTGFWAGITVGRMLLGFVTGRFFRTEKHAVVVYLLAAMVLELLFWLIPNFVASAICSAFLGALLQILILGILEAHLLTITLAGFFLGPLFPAAVICVAKLVPRSIQVPAIGMCAAVGASGASIVPFLVGVIADAKGVKSLQPIILACLALCLGIWLILPKLPRRA